MKDPSLISVSDLPVDGGMKAARTRSTPWKVTTRVSELRQLDDAAESLLAFTASGREELAAHDGLQLLQPYISAATP